MSRENKEIKTYFGRCRCCLDYGYLNNMWEEHYNGDEVEIYGEMLTQCYALPWEHSVSVKHDQICDKCVQKLRSAYTFRKLVIKSLRELMQEIENDKLADPKIEIEVFKTEAADNTQMASTNVMYEDGALFSKENGIDMDTEDDEKDAVFYEDIEYLDEEVTLDTKGATKESLPSEPEVKRQRKKIKWLEKLSLNERNKRPKTLKANLRKGKKDKIAELKEEVFKIEPRDDTRREPFALTCEEDVLFSEDNKLNIQTDVENEAVSYEDVEYLEEELAVDMKNVNNKEPLLVDIVKKDKQKKKKWPKKLQPKKRNVPFKQYTADDLRGAMDAVRSDKMSAFRASQLYKVPWKTIEGKLRKEKKGETNDTDNYIYDFIKEIKTILTYTNGTPYRSSITSQYSCMYCVDGTFDDPVDLRNHTRTKHMDERTKKVDLIIRPHWQYEILKLDIDNLLCVVCCTPIYDWNRMFQHLKESHNVILDQAYRRVIPYILGSEMKCALCEEKFLSYHRLDSHMNTHYDNNVCGSCGDSFLTLVRLKRHMKTHSLKTWRCRHCKKVFNSVSNRTQHENIVHYRSMFYRCTYCDVRFNTEKDRKCHAMELHAEKLRVLTCELCGKTFKWRPDFLCHMKELHGDKNYKCSECGKKYFRMHKLKNHVLMCHSGKEGFSCHHCEKNFSRKNGLNIHLIKQHSDGL